ncbi:MAG: recombinase family protein [Lachnospiraceae bacterium]|nr:recombinase family protein [Lachnospiraceae bacterium]
MARKSRRIPAGAAEAASVRTKMKAAAYIRLSRETEGSLERDTIGNQTALVQEFIKRQDDLELYDTYIDDSVSGTTFVRPAFDRMLADMRAGRIQAVVVKDMSRIGRDYIEAGSLVEHVFPLYGMRLISITDGFDTDKDANGLMMAVANLTNAMYAQDISRKINAAKADMAERGIPIGKLPYGYRMNRDDPKNPRMEIDEEPAAVVRRIFAEFLSGKGTTLIARELNEEGVLTDREYRFRKNGQHEKMGRYKWSACTVQQVLNNETYTGRYSMNKVRMKMNQKEKRIFIPKEEWRTFENHHPAIIPKDDFAKVRAMKQKKSRGGKNPPNYLKRKVFCGCCGGHMGILNPAAKNPKYECRRKAFYEQGCSTGQILKSAVYGAVFKAVKDQMRLFMDEDSAIGRYMEWAGKRPRTDQYRGEILRRQEKLRILEEKKVALYEDFRSGLLDEKEYLLLNGRYTADMQVLSDGITEMRSTADGIKKAEETVESVRKRLAGYRGKRKLSQEMADSLIEKVVIHSAERIEVVFSFNDELKFLAGEHGRKEADGNAA